MESEKDLATFYQAHRDDPDMWGEPEEAPEPVPARRTGLSVTITVRFSPSEADAIRRVARAMALTYSEVVRRAVHSFTRPERELRPGGEYQWSEDASHATSTAQSAMTLDSSQSNVETLLSILVDD